MKNQVLIISLIICFILAATLGVVCYFLAKDHTESVQKEKQATEKAQKAETEYRTLMDQYNKTVAKIGYANKVTNNDELLQKMDTDIKQALVSTTKVPKSYKDAVVSLGQELLRKNQEIAGYKQQVATYKSQTQQQTDMTRTQKETYETQHNKSTTDFAKQKADDKRRFDEMEGEYKKLTQKVDKIEQEAKALNEKYRVETADAKEAAQRIAGINTMLSIKLDQMTQADFDVPDGKILYVNQADKTVRLNIGEVEGVRALSKFGVYPSNTLDLGRAESKGTIEITRVLGPHESEGKILEDEMVTPVMSGDMIYTPLWKAGEPVQYALGYDLDIDGDGQSDLNTIMDLINANGAKVALFINDDGKVSGKMSADVTAYIVSDTPILEILANDQKKEQSVKTEIQNTCMNLIDEARLNNVREMKLSEFLRKVHYRKLANISKFQQFNGVDLDKAGAVAPTVSDTPIAPIYSNKTQAKPPISSGTLSPIYKSGKTQPAPASSGRVSDYYFRKRNP